MKHSERNRGGKNMFNWLRKLLNVPIPIFYDREGNAQCIQAGMDNLFEERDKLSYQKVKLCLVIQKLPHEDFGSDSFSIIRFFNRVEKLSCLWHPTFMKKKTTEPKRSSDMNQLAKRIVDIATGQDQKEIKKPKDSKKKGK